MRQRPIEPDEVVLELPPNNTPIPLRASGQSSPRRYAIPDVVTQPIPQPPLLPQKQEILGGFFEWLWARMIAPRLTTIGLGMLLTGCILAAWLYWLGPLWRGYQDALHYGDARISTLDTDVGHGGTSHFLAFYLNAQVVIVEISHNGDATKVHAFSQRVDLTGSSIQRPVVTLQVHMMNGKKSLFAYVEGNELPVVFYNTGDSFQLTPPDN